MEDLRDYINKLRHDFSHASLSEGDVSKSAIKQFEVWFKEAVHAKVPEANAMVLSTVGKNGMPSARVLLLRNFDEKGFVFYTNYNSQKADEMSANSNACITFFWAELERQVRIEGVVEQQSSSESDKYFESRPRGSKLGAWVSPQSEKIDSRTFIDEKLKEYEKKFPGENVPRPPFWGGYVLKPSKIEFWQGRPSRLHDRIVYEKDKEGEWKIYRLAP